MRKERWSWGRRSFCCLWIESRVGPAATDQAAIVRHETGPHRIFWFLANLTNPIISERDHDAAAPAAPASVGLRPLPPGVSQIFSTPSELTPIITQALAAHPLPTRDPGRWPHIPRGLPRRSKPLPLADQLRASPYAHRLFQTGGPRTVHACSCAPSASWAPVGCHAVTIREERSFRTAAVASSDF